MTRLFLATIFLLAAGCGDPAATDTAGGDSRIGDSCITGSDCVSELACIAQPTGNICVERCAIDSDCTFGVCKPVQGQATGWCDISRHDPQPDPNENNGQIDPDPDPNENNGQVEPDPDPDPNENNGQVDPDPEPEPEPDPRATYPSGPYGTSVGSVMAQEEFQARDGSTFTLGDVFAEEDAKLLLIFSTGAWCGSCAGKARDIDALYQRYGSIGLYPVVSLYEDTNYQPCTGPQAGQYAQQHSLSYTAVADPSGVLFKYFAEQGHPQVLLVDVETMTILAADTGWYPDFVESQIQNRLQ